VLAGGGCLINGMRDYVQKSLREFGPCSVSAVNDPLFAGSEGALKLAQDMPVKYWEPL
jgi:hypothetical protein